MTASPNGSPATQGLPVPEGTRSMPLAYSAMPVGGHLSHDGPHDVGWGRLTEAELRVVRLVASGATNRDAAHALYLSPHTVSSHLRSAFMKLGLHTRTQLAWLAFQVQGRSAEST
jgi:DNA-binding CsgD family transcriptional regulator